MGTSGGAQRCAHESDGRQSGSDFLAREFFSLRTPEWPQGSHCARGGQNSSLEAEHCLDTRRGIFSRCCRSAPATPNPGAALASCHRLSTGDPRGSATRSKRSGNHRGLASGSSADRNKRASSTCSYRRTGSGKRTCSIASTQASQHRSRSGQRFGCLSCGCRG